MPPMRLDRPATGAAAALCLFFLGGCGREAPPRADANPRASAASVRTAAAPGALAYTQEPLGSRASAFGRPLVTHVSIVDVDRDKLADILYCDGAGNTIRWIRQSPRGVFSEHVIARGIPGPVHASVADLDGDGRAEILIASMGQITPNNDRIGAVVVLDHVVDLQFRPRVLLEGVARVTDVRAANLSGHTDGKRDLVVGQFGYAQGEVRWMRNLGDGRFESQQVSNLSGCVHTPVADFDGDGRQDFAALISQEWEEVHLFLSGSGSPQGRVIWGSTNEDFGSSGLEVADINRDGRPDLVYTNGDGFDYAGYGTRPWHGIQWLENQGGGAFRFHRVGDMPGAYSPCAADLDGDGDTDLLAVSGFADWDDPTAVSVMAWLNDGKGGFEPRVIAHRPTQLVSAAVGDLDGDGTPEIVTGGFHAYPPFKDMSNITLWRRQ